MSYHHKVLMDLEDEFLLRTPLCLVLFLMCFLELTSDDEAISFKSSSLVLAGVSLIPLCVTISLSFLMGDVSFAAQSSSASYKWGITTFSLLTSKGSSIRSSCWSSFELNWLLQICLFPFFFQYFYLLLYLTKNDFL